MAVAGLRRQYTVQASDRQRPCAITAGNDAPPSCMATMPPTLKQWMPNREWSIPACEQARTNHDLKAETDSCPFDGYCRRNGAARQVGGNQAKCAHKARQAPTAEDDGPTRHDTAPLIPTTVHCCKNSAPAGMYKSSYPSPALLLGHLAIA